VQFSQRERGDLPEVLRNVPPLLLGEGLGVRY